MALSASASTELCPRLEAGYRLPLENGAGGLSKQLVLGFLIFLRLIPPKITDIVLLLSTLSPSRVRA